MKKKEEKNITIDDLAMMVQRGFQSAEDQFQELGKEMRSEIGNVRGKIDDLREEMRLGFKRVDGSLIES